MTINEVPLRWGRLYKQRFNMKIILVSVVLIVASSIAVYINDRGIKIISKTKSVDGSLQHIPSSSLSPLQSHDSSSYSLPYYNLPHHNHPNNNNNNNNRRRLSNEPGPLTGYAGGGPVIAILVDHSEKDVHELTLALQSLTFLRGDDPDYPAPILVFNEGKFTEEQIQMIVESTNRPIAFPLVDFTEFPEGFNPEGEASFLVKGRSKWGYYQMIRFWVSRIWIHPAIEPFGTVMRLDSDSCFKESNNLLPNLASDDIVYYSQYVGYEPSKETVQGLFDFCTEWMKSVDKMPGNPMMWNFIKTTWEQTGTLPVLRTNFEVARKSFMQKRDVYRWLELITERPPFPIFRYRWGDAVIRFLMIAIFAENHMVMLSRPPGYAHKELCDDEAYLARYGTIG